MVKDGYWYGLPLVLIAGGLMGFWLHQHSRFLLVVTIFFAILSFLVLNFFRDPERPVPAEPCAVVSPADGLVVQLAEEEFEGRPVRRLSIFMSPLDVHVNRAPIAGSIMAINYKKGSFRVASQDLASIENLLPSRMSKMFSPSRASKASWWSSKSLACWPAVSYSGSD
jgi:phosphatidylserine decarboxylase